MVNKFEEGDVVQIKSGGPLMTIYKMCADGKTCGLTWYENGIKTLTSFEVIALRKIDDEKYKKLKESL